MKLMLRYFSHATLALLLAMPLTGALAQDDAPDDKPAGFLEDLDIDIEVENKGELPRIVIRRRAENLAGAYWLGLMLDPETEGAGVAVLEVLPGTPAAKAGMKKGDRILQFGGKKIGSPAALAAEVKRNGDKEVQVVYERDGRKLNVRLKAARRDVVAGGENGDIIKLWRNFAPGGAPGRMLFLRPGMVFPRDAARMVSPRLPEDFSFEVQGQGKDKPSKIVIKKGGKTWSVTEDKWEDVPREIRNMLPAPLRGGFEVPGFNGAWNPVGPMQVPARAVPQPRVARPAIRIEAAPREDTRRKVQRLEQQLQRLMRDMKALKQQHLRDHSDRNDAAEEATDAVDAVESVDIIEDTAKPQEAGSTADEATAESTAG